MPNQKRAVALLNFAFKPVTPKYSWLSTWFLPNPPRVDHFCAVCLQTLPEAESSFWLSQGPWEVSQHSAAVCVHLEFSLGRGPYLASNFIRNSWPQIKWPNAAWKGTSCIECVWPVPYWLDPRRGEWARKGLIYWPAISLAQSVSQQTPSAFEVWL